MVSGHCPPDDRVTKGSSPQNLPLHLRLGLVLRLGLPIFSVAYLLEVVPRVDHPGELPT